MIFTILFIIIMVSAITIGTYFIGKEAGKEEERNDWMGAINKGGMHHIIISRGKTFEEWKERWFKIEEVS